MSTVISKNIVLEAAELALPLNHPRIGWENHVREATISASTSESDFPANNIKSPSTVFVWRPIALSAWLQADFLNARDVNYCGIAAHNFRSKGCEVTLQYWDGGAWVTVASKQPANDSPLMFIFDNVYASRWRVVLDGDEIPSVGVWYLGKVLEVQRRIYQGHTPITQSHVTDIYPNESETGQFIGRTVRALGAQTSIALKNLKSEWIREYFDPFKDSAIQYPFFWAWRPEKYPEEVALCWTSSDLRPTNSGPADMMSVNFKVKARI